MAGSAITFTPGEVAIFYAARVPDLEQRRAAKWRGPCPIHHGKKDSFEVRPHTGRWHCYSRCGRGGDMLDLEAELNGGDFPTRKAEVFRLVGRPEPMNGHHPTSMNLNPAGRAPTKPTEPTSPAGKWHEIVRYPYVDRDGRPLFEVVRYLKPDGDKAFKQCRPDGRGGIVWNLEGIKRVPYHLPKMLNADTVYLPEGEKDVHTLEEWGLVASCNPGGAGSSHRYREWADFFRGRQIVILPDNDEPGRKHAAAVAAALLSVAASLRIVELPGLPEEGDVTDWRDAGEHHRAVSGIDSGGGTDGRGGTLRTAGTVGLGGQRTSPGGERGSGGRMAEAGTDPKRASARASLLRRPSPGFVPSPGGGRGERMQVPMDYPAVVMVLCLAGAVNRRAVIQPKANDTGWLVVPNLWGGIIAPPGIHEITCNSAATHPLNQIQTEWRQEHEEALKDYARDKEEYELRLAAWKEQYKASAKNGKAAPDRPDDKPDRTEVAAADRE